MPGHFAQTGPVLGRLVRAGPVPVHFCSRWIFFRGILRGPYLSPRTLDGPEASVLLHGPKRCWRIFRNLCRGSILHNLCRGILNGLYGPHLCVRIILGRPSLELPKQGFRRWLTIFRLTLTGGFRGGSNFVAGRRVLCGQRQSLSIGGRLNCWRRLIGAGLKRRFVDQRSCDVRKERHGISHR